MISPQPPSSRNSIELLPFVSAKMKKTYGIVVCILIIILDVTAGILGIQAEIAQNKVYPNWNENYVLINIYIIFVMDMIFFSFQLYYVLFDR